MSLVASSLSSALRVTAQGLPAGSSWISSMWVRNTAWSSAGWPNKLSP